MKKDNQVYVKHILDAITLIESYIQGKTFSDFESDHLIQDGVVRQIEVIGEAARQLSEEFKATFADIEWREIIAMRNKLIHEYFDIDVENVWLVTQKEIPELENRLKNIK